MVNIEQAKERFMNLGVEFSTLGSASLNDYADTLINIRLLYKNISDRILEFLEMMQNAKFNSDFGYQTNKRIPILGDSSIIECSEILRLSPGYLNIFDIVESNNDLFYRRYLPLWTSFPGDYISINVSSGKIYFTNHEYGGNERKQYLISPNLNEFIDRLNILNYEEDDNQRISASNNIIERPTEKWLSLIDEWKKSHGYYN